MKYKPIVFATAMMVVPGSLAYCFKTLNPMLLDAPTMRITRLRDARSCASLPPVAESDNEVLGKNARMMESGRINIPVTKRDKIDDTIILIEMMIFCMVYATVGMRLKVYKLLTSRASCCSLAIVVVVF